jgi:hypothetical protein
MTTDIEKAVYRSGEAHAVTKMVQESKALTLVVAPWSDLSSGRTVRFENVSMRSIAPIQPDSDDLDMPWDIIGFDVVQKKRAAYEFCLHCAGIEYVFCAQWPSIGV